MSEWRNIEIDGLALIVRDTALAHGHFPFKFVFVDERGCFTSYDPLHARMDALDAWCRETFGPPAQYDGVDQCFGDGTWWRTETHFRFNDKTEAAAFKITWT